MWKHPFRDILINFLFSTFKVLKVNKTSFWLVLFLMPASPCSRWPTFLKHCFVWMDNQNCCLITRTRLFKYIENFTTRKGTFQIKKSDLFHISAQNIDCGYSLEPPLWGGSNEYPQSINLIRNMKNNVYPCKPKFFYIKVGFKGVKII